ncbi:hypothetical protein EH223_16645 [candidate division KSB1 bacterium]|nr:hypothetical protein [candidate division KSB1 bacterium]RQW00976.1 MAG: hypothetical protein EH223_16645 [candidate division KSB1 bacterium]
MSTKRLFGLFRSGFFAFLLCGHSLFASFEDVVSGARVAAMANAGVAQNFGAESIEINPAGISCAPDDFDMIMFYTKPFGLDELSIANVAVRYSRSPLSGAGSVRFYGCDRYHESLISAALSFELTSNLTIGCAARYGLLAIHRYGQTSVFLFDCGAICTVAKSLKWGFSAKNVNFATIGVNKEPLARSLTTGLSTSPHKKVVLNIDMHKETRFPLDIRCAVGYEPLPRFVLRAGVGNEPVRFCAGFSITWAIFRIDYAFSSHAELGGTHMFSIGIF